MYPMLILQCRKFLEKATYQYLYFSPQTRPRCFPEPRLGSSVERRLDERRSPRGRPHHHHDVWHLQVSLSLLLLSTFSDKKTFVLMALIKLLHLFTIFSSNENAMKLLFMAYAERERGGRTDFTEEELVSNIFIEHSVWLIFGFNCFLA